MIDLDYTIRVRVPIIVLTVIVTYGVTFWVSTPTRKGIGYEPEQPIAFSHRLHAGEMQIDCRYCHVGVNKSRHATVPSVDTCMNCHSVVQTAGKKEEDGFLYNADSVVPRKASLASVIGGISDASKNSPDELKNSLQLPALKASGVQGTTQALNDIITDAQKRKVFIEHFQDKVEWEDKDIVPLLADHSDEAKAQKLARFMLDEVFPVNTYKSAELKKLRAYFKEGKPLKWKRIYRLPEYVYFNHSVHVNSGIDCQRCHGAVEKMDTLKQMKPYDMGRCLDCHRGDYHSGLKENIKGPQDCGACHR